MVYYLVSTAVLAGLLFIPVRKLIWVMSVRRLERRWQRPLDERERAGQRNRAMVIAAILVVVFSALFNYSLVGPVLDG